MEERRWPWLISSVLLALSGVAAAGATYLWWLPCQGAFLVGTILESRDSRQFSDECLVRMDSGTPFPLTTAVEPHVPWLYGLAVATVLLAALAWLVPLAMERTSVLMQCAGWSFGMALVVLGWASATPVRRDAQVGPVGDIAFVAVDLTALVTLGCVLLSRRNGSLRTTVRLVVLVWSTAAFGAFRIGMDYVVMGTWNSSNWDIPPGTGSLAALGLLLGSVTVAVLTPLRSPRADRIGRPVSARAG